MAKKPPLDLHYINESLRELAVPIESLTPDPRNARVHNQRNLDSIKASLDTFGQQKPVVATTEGVIVAGHGLVEAAKLVGWTHVAVVQMAPDKAVAYGIADNRTGELSTWASNTLAELMSELVEQDRSLVIGFTDEELEAVMSGWAVPGHDTEDVGEHDPEKDTFVVKLEGVTAAHKAEVLASINEAMGDKGLPYTAKAY